MSEGMKYCLNCDQAVTPTLGVNWILAIYLLLFLLFPGIGYIIYAHGLGGRCPICNSTNWKQFKIRRIE